jgi:hypothetical protein
MPREYGGPETVQDASPETPGDRRMTEDNLRNHSTGPYLQDRMATEEEVHGLSRKIAEEHEHLADLHRRRAQYDREVAQDHFLIDPAHPAGGPEEDLLSHLGPPQDGSRHLLDKLYTERGWARLSRGEYDRALVDFSAAILNDWTPLRAEQCGPAYEGVSAAKDAIGSLLEGASDPKSRLQPGYLIVGDWAVLARYPLSDDGSDAALRFAQRLADDAESRSRIDNRYLTDSEFFEIRVYALDGQTSRLVHEIAKPE